MTSVFASFGLNVSPPYCDGKPGTLPISVVVYCSAYAGAICSSCADDDAAPNITNATPTQREFICPECRPGRTIQQATVGNRGKAEDRRQKTEGRRFQKVSGR